MYNRLPIGVIFFPSLRGVAYFTAMASLFFAPEEVILMAGEIAGRDNIRRENERYGYDRMFFDVAFDVPAYLAASGARLHRVETNDINSPLIRDAVLSSQIRRYVFTGGGIIKKPLFETGKEFIHVHPGRVPDFRGSTCFYYSLLEECTLGSTAFFMVPQLDAGEVIAESGFRINYRIEPDQPLFVDYVLDPYIRAETLKKIVPRLGADVIDGRPQASIPKPAYYIMHPALRLAAIRDINRHYDPGKASGIWEVGREAGGASGVS